MGKKSKQGWYRQIVQIVIETASSSLTFTYGPNNTERRNHDGSEYLSHLGMVVTTFLHFHGTCDLSLSVARQPASWWWSTPTNSWSLALRLTFLNMSGIGSGGRSGQDKPWWCGQQWVIQWYESYHVLILKRKLARLSADTCREQDV